MALPNTRYSPTPSRTTQQMTMTTVLSRFVFFMSGSVGHHSILDYRNCYQIVWKHQVEWSSKGPQWGLGQTLSIVCATRHPQEEEKKELTERRRRSKNVLIVRMNPYANPAWWGTQIHLKGLSSGPPAVGPGSSRPPINRLIHPVLQPFFGITWTSTEFDSASPLQDFAGSCATSLRNALNL